MQLNGVTVRFGGLIAVNELSFAVEEKTIHGLIGPNGAGKSTVFNCFSRFYQPAAGTIDFAGHDLLALRSDQVMGLGIARTFQNVELFRGMTALENVLAGQHSLAGSGFFGDLFATPAVKRQETLRRQAAIEALDFLGVADTANSFVGSLAYGKQKLIEFARALVSKPKLLLLDEPAAGLNPQETSHLGDLIVELRDRLGITILLVEHDMSLVMRICDTITVMEFGRKIAEGNARAIQNDPAVIKAYLGEVDASA
jgi:branched-chain amino acid transport system ATP-binding protein